MDRPNYDDELVSLDRMLRNRNLLQSDRTEISLKSASIEFNSLKHIQGRVAMIELFRKKFINLILSHKSSPSYHHLDHFGCKKKKKRLHTFDVSDKGVSTGNKTSDIFE